MKSYVPPLLLRPLALWKKYVNNFIKIPKIIVVLASYEKKSYSKLHENDKIF